LEIPCDRIGIGGISGAYGFIRRTAVGNTELPRDDALVIELTASRRPHRHANGDEARSNHPIPRLSHRRPSKRKSQKAPDTSILPWPAPTIGATWRPCRGDGLVFGVGQRR